MRHRCADTGMPRQALCGECVLRNRCNFGRHSPPEYIPFVSCGKGLVQMKITASVFVSCVIQLQRPVDPFVRSVVVYGEILPPDAPSFSGPLFHTDVMFTCHGLCVNSSEITRRGCASTCGNTPRCRPAFPYRSGQRAGSIGFENLVRRTQ
jgi:hypothetical protein